MQHLAAILISQLDQKSDACGFNLFEFEFELAGRKIIFFDTYMHIYGTSFLFRNAHAYEI